MAYPWSAATKVAARWGEGRTERQGPHCRWRASCCAAASPPAPLCRGPCTCGIIQQPCCAAAAPLPAGEGQLCMHLGVAREGATTRPSRGRGRGHGPGAARCGRRPSPAPSRVARAPQKRHSHSTAGALRGRGRGSRRDAHSAAAGSRRGGAGPPPVRAASHTSWIPKQTQWAAAGDGLVPRGTLAPSLSGTQVFSRLTPPVPAVKAWPEDVGEGGGQGCWLRGSARGLWQAAACARAR
jgi:hypothetical protein